MKPTIAAESDVEADGDALCATPAPGRSWLPPKWADFLAGDTDALPLRVFEVLFTSTFLIWMGRCFVTWREWLTVQGFHLDTVELTALGYPAPFGLLSGIGVLSLAITIGIAGLGHILNRARRIALLGLFGSAIYVQGADPMAAFTLNKLYIGIYGLLLVSPGYSRYDASGRLRVSRVVIRIIQATFILQYFAAGLVKAFWADWLKFSDVLYTQVQGVYRTDVAAWLLRVLPVWSWTLMQGLILLFELEAPALFCWRKLRLAAFVLGIGLHLAVAILMKDLIFFSGQMLCFYALFLTAEEWRGIAGLALRRSDAQQPVLAESN